MPNLAPPRTALQPFKGSVAPHNASVVQPRSWTILSQLIRLQQDGITDPANSALKVPFVFLAVLSDYKQLLEMNGMSIKSGMNLYWTNVSTGPQSSVASRPHT